MMPHRKFFAVGTSHKTGSLNLRETLARYHGGRAQDILESLNRKLPDGLEWCALSTCNRFEIYASGSPDLGSKLKEYLIAQLDPSLRAEGEEAVYLLQGAEAVSHLYTVASGLDSMVVGESEILGQTKEAYETARIREYTGTILNPVFQRALAVGKRVRAETKIGEGRLSVASVALELARRIFADFSSVSVAVVGAGAMGHETAKGLLAAQPKSQMILSRTLARAQELAAQSGASAFGLEALPQALVFCDVVVTQLSSEIPVITRKMVQDALAKRNRPLFFLDIALPRNVEEGVAGLGNVYLYNLDDLKAIAQSNYERRKAEITAAEAIVKEETAKSLARINGAKPFPNTESAPAVPA